MHQQEPGFDQPEGGKQSRHQRYAETGHRQRWRFRRRRHGGRRIRPSHHGGRVVGAHRTRGSSRGATPASPRSNQGLDLRSQRTARRRASLTTTSPREHPRREHAQKWSVGRFAHRRQLTETLKGSRHLRRGLDRLHSKRSGPSTGCRTNVVSRSIQTTLCGRGRTQTEHLAAVRAAGFRVGTGETRSWGRASRCSRGRARGRSEP